MSLMTGIRPLLEDISTMEKNERTGYYLDGYKKAYELWQSSNEGGKYNLIEFDFDYDKKELKYVDLIEQTYSYGEGNKFHSRKRVFGE